eukprot:2182409-Pyramimonas_sp.AAC.1
MATRTVAAQWVSEVELVRHVIRYDAGTGVSGQRGWQRAPAQLPERGKLSWSPLSSVAALGSGECRVDTGSRPCRCPAKCGRRLGARRDQLQQWDQS